MPGPRQQVATDEDFDDCDAADILDPGQGRDDTEIKFQTQTAARQDRRLYIQVRDRSGLAARPGEAETGKAEAENGQRAGFGDRDGRRCDRNVIDVEQAVLAKLDEAV